MRILTSDNFFEEVFTVHKLSMIQFSAEWCDSCKEFQMDTLPKLEELYPNVLFFKIDIDASPDLADRYNITKLPTFLFIRNREVVNFIIGNEIIFDFKRVINDILNK